MGTPSAVYVAFYKRTDGVYFVREASATDDHLWGPIAVTESGLTLLPDLPEHVMVGTTEVSPAPPVVEEPVPPTPVASPVVQDAGTRDLVLPPPTRVRSKIAIGDFRCVSGGECKAVESGFRKQLATLQTCHEQFLKSDSDLDGRIEIRLHVSKGRVTGAEVLSDSTGSPDFVRCLLSKVKRYGCIPIPDCGVTLGAPEMG